MSSKQLTSALSLWTKGSHLEEGSFKCHKLLPFWVVNNLFFFISPKVGHKHRYPRWDKVIEKEGGIEIHLQIGPINFLFICDMVTFHDFESIID